jgi:hypothetical protein
MGEACSAPRIPCRRAPHLSASVSEKPLEPWRTVTRSGLWRPSGPTSRATSSSSMACSTCRPVPTARASSPRGRRWPVRPRQRNGHSLGQLQLHVVDSGGGPGMSCSRTSVMVLGTWRHRRTSCSEGGLSTHGHEPAKLGGRGTIAIKASTMSEITGDGIQTRAGPCRPVPQRVESLSYDGTRL